jgi:HEAT repeat protein
MSLGLALEHGGTGKTPSGLSYVDLTTQVAGPLTKALKDPEELVRAHAAIALWRIRKQTAKAIPIIAKALQSRSVPLRQLGASALDKIAPKAAVAVPAMQRALSDQDVEVRVLSALALHKQTGKGDAKRVIPVLTAALRTKATPDELRDRIVKQLGLLARADARVWPTVIAALRDPYYHARGAAVKALTSDSRQARRAIPNLLRILTIDTGYVRDEARKLLLHLRAERQVLTTLIKALKSKDYDVRYWSTNDLEELGPRARAAVPALIHALRNDPRVPVRAGSAAALGAIGQRTPDVLEALRESSRSKEWAVRGRAKDALKKLGR